MCRPSLNFLKLLIWLGAFSILVNCASPVQTPPRFDRIQLVVQGSIVAKDTLSPTLRAASDIATILLPGVGGVIAKSVISRRLSQVGDEIQITNANFLENEIYRHLTCEISESGYELTSTTNLSREMEWLTQEDLQKIKDRETFYAYLRNNLELNSNWSVDISADAILLVNYYMVFEEESVADYVDELEGEQAEVYWFLVPTDQTSDLLYSDYDSIAVDDGYIGATSWLDVSEILDTLILTNSWPTLNFTPDPSCSARSYIYNEIATSLNQESDREAVEKFLEKHDIDFRRGNNNQTLIGTYTWDNSNRNIASGPAEVIIYVGADRKGRFESFRVE